MRQRFESLPAAARAAVSTVALLVAWAIAAVVLPQGAPIGVVVSGAILGIASALTAVGLVLIYRANRIVNFSYGAMGGVVGLTAVRTFVIWKWNYGLVIVLGVALGVVVGMLTELLVIRRFERSSRLILTVATIGLTQLFGGLELLIPDAIFDPKALTLGGFDKLILPAWARRVKRLTGQFGDELLQFTLAARRGQERLPNMGIDVEIIVINDSTARNSALQAGQVHMINRIDPKVAKLLGKAPGIKVANISGRGHYVFIMHCDTAPFDNNDLRLALKYSINRQEMVDKILDGLKFHS